MSSKESTKESSKSASASKKSSTTSGSGKSTSKVPALKANKKVSPSKPMKSDLKATSIKSKSKDSLLEDLDDKSQKLVTLKSDKTDKRAIKPKVLTSDVSDSRSVSAGKEVSKGAQMLKTSVEESAPLKAESSIKIPVKSSEKIVEKIAEKAVDTLIDSRSISVSDLSREASPVNAGSSSSSAGINSVVHSAVRPGLQSDGDRSKITAPSPSMSSSLASAPTVTDSDRGPARDSQSHRPQGGNFSRPSESNLRHDSHNSNRSPLPRGEGQSNSQNSPSTYAPQGQGKGNGFRNENQFSNQKQGGNSSQGGFNQDNYLEIKISGSLYRKLKELSRSEGLTVDELANELVTEGCVVRAWELIERKAAMKGNSGNSTHNGPSPGNGRNNPGFNNNNKQNYNPKSKQGRSNYNKIMEDPAHFLEYVRNQEKRQR